MTDIAKREKALAEIAREANAALSTVTAPPQDQPPSYRLLFGYKHVSGVPYCPCGDPGNYLSMEQSTSDPLDVLFRCWCGSKMTGRMDSAAELADFLAKNGVKA